jgi:hypothetical protein
MHLLLEPLQRFADTLADLREFARPENDENDDQNNDQFRNTHRAEHDPIPL